MDRGARRAAGTLTIAVMLLTSGFLPGCSDSVELNEALPGKNAAEPESEASSHAAAPAESKSPLAGTDWQLVEFQSMDDAVGTVSPDEPSLYTMHLNEDGSVSMGLNCNNAQGTWTAEPSDDGQSGRFVFGPLATTSALCPPPSMDEQIAAHSEYVRSFLLKDGRLYLSLMADGGIYTWEPRADNSEVPFEAEPDAEIEAAILEASPDYTREIVGVGGHLARYLYGRVDLDEDGSDEVLVYLLGSIFCGTGGCNLLLLSEVGDGYRLVNDFTISRLPVIVSPAESAGWHNLIRLESGGGAPSSYVTHVFDGEKYVEHERMPAEAAPEGTRYLAGEFTFEDGVPLEPAS